MTLDQEYFDKMTNNEWVEWDGKAFDAGFAYVLKEGTPEDFVKEFNEFKALFDMYKK